MAHYIVMYDKRSNIPGDGRFHRLLGPFRIMATAELYVKDVADFCREHDWRTEFCTFGIAEYADEAPTVLNDKYPEIMQIYQLTSN